MNNNVSEKHQLALHAGEAADLLKQLANVNRLMICCSLVEGEMSVMEINAQLPLSQSALSQHLAKLRLSNILATRKESQTVLYRLANDKVLSIISTLKNIYCP